VNGQDAEVAVALSALATGKMKELTLVEPEAEQMTA
jgi:hypothetical protein